MNRIRIPRALVLLLLVVPLALTSGCMTGKIPSAQFSGMTVKTVQKDPGSEKLELDVGFNFKVKNPLGIKLKIPAHTFGLEIDGAPAASTGTKNGFDVASGTAKTVTYDFRLDLSKDGVGRAFGKDATIAFTADANVDVPKEIIDILGSIPGAGAVSDQAKKAGGDLLSTGFEALGGAGGGGMGKAKLTFSHEGSLRLPKFPQIRGKDGAKPEVALVGKSETASLDNVIGQLTSKVEPLAAFFDQFENAAMNQQVDIPVGELLERIGVPANLTSAALTAINGVLQLNGKPSIGSKNNAVQVPVNLPKLTSLLGTLDPQAAKKVNDFQAGWLSFKNNPSIGNLVIPTALPQGIRVATPFQIDNPNEFAIMAPSFKLGIVAADGSPVALIGVTAPGVMGGKLGQTKQQLVNVAGGGSSELQLVSEFNWDKLGTNLLSSAATGAPPDMSGLRLMGEISIDPGYGPITVPINIPLGPGAMGSGSGKSTSGSSKDTGSSSKDTGSSSKDTGSSSKDTGSSSKDTGSSSKDSGTKDESSSSSKSKSKSKGK
jgi:hypothetical protein